MKVSLLSSSKQENGYRKTDMDVGRYLSLAMNNIL